MPPVYAFAYEKCPPNRGRVSPLESKGLADIVKAQEARFDALNWQISLHSSEIRNLENTGSSNSTEKGMSRRQGQNYALFMKSLRRSGI